MSTSFHPTCSTSATASRAIMPIVISSVLSGVEYVDSPIPLPSFKLAPNHGGNLLTYGHTQGLQSIVKQAP